MGVTQNSGRRGCATLYAQGWFLCGVISGYGVSLDGVGNEEFKPVKR